MKDIHFGNKWFECRISQTSPDFPSGLPPIKPQLRKMPSNGYIGKKNLDLKVRYTRPFIDLMSVVNDYQQLSGKLVSLYDDMLSEYDRDILKTTCANSLWKGSHTDLDATGGPGAFNDFAIPDKVAESVIKYYLKVPQISEDKISLSMVRGKNTGWPHPISGMQRELNLALYAVHSALAVKAGEESLFDVIRQLESFHGQSFAIYGERSQHTAKTMPMIMREGFFFSNNFEVRKRGILMVPKFVVMKNRVGVQHTKHRILHSSVHNQDRTHLIEDIPNAMKRFVVKAVDWPKFDFTFGGKAGRSILPIIAKLSDGTLSESDLDLEFSMPLLYFGYRGAFLDPSAPQLPSGASFTSLMGCIANFSVIVWSLSNVTNTSPDDVIASLDSKWFLRCWGDDTIIGLDENWCTHAKLFAEINSIIKKEMDVEPVIKYLGDVYGGDEITDVRMGYQLSRWIQQQFLPERIKDYPFSLIGYIARLDKLDSSIQAEVHKRAFQVWDDKKLGPYFSFSERESVMERAVSDIEKYASKISQIDDILQFMTHGNEEGFYSDDDTDSAFIRRLLGVVSVDISDPTAMIKDHGEFRLLRSAMDRFLQVGFPAYAEILTALRSDFNLKYQRGDLVY